MFRKNVGGFLFMFYYLSITIILVYSNIIIIHKKQEIAYINLTPIKWSVFICLILDDLIHIFAISIFELYTNIILQFFVIHNV